MVLNIKIGLSQPGRSRLASLCAFRDHRHRFDKEARIPILALSTAGAQGGSLRACISASYASGI